MTLPITIKQVFSLTIYRWRNLSLQRICKSWQSNSRPGVWGTIWNHVVSLAPDAPPSICFSPPQHMPFSLSFCFTWSHTNIGLEDAVYQDWVYAGLERSELKRIKAAFGIDYKTHGASQQPVCRRKYVEVLIYLSLKKIKVSSYWTWREISYIDKETYRI